MQLQRIIRALRHRNYRLFFAGQGISVIGTWIQRMAWRPSAAGSLIGATSEPQ